jgi:hypothetical protein
LQAQLGRHLQSASSYLLELEQAIRAYEPEVHALRRFRLATNQVRQTAWAVEHWRQEQRSRHGKNGNGKGKANGNGDSAQPVVQTEIWHRALEANLALLEELETNVAAAPPEEVEDLLRSISILLKRLEHLRIR